jgi:hypothetical protein
VQILFSQQLHLTAEAAVVSIHHRLQNLAVRAAVVLAVMEQKQAAQILHLVKVIQAVQVVKAILLMSLALVVAAVVQVP